MSEEGEGANRVSQTPSRRRLKASSEAESTTSAGNLFHGSNRQILFYYLKLILRYSMGKTSHHCRYLWMNGVIMLHFSLKQGNLRIAEKVIILPISLWEIWQPKTYDKIAVPKKLPLKSVISVLCGVFIWIASLVAPRIHSSFFWHLSEHNKR